MEILDTRVSNVFVYYDCFYLVFFFFFRIGRASSERSYVGRDFLDGKGRGGVREGRERSRYLPAVAIIVGF